MGRLVVLADKNFNKLLNTNKNFERTTLKWHLGVSQLVDSAFWMWVGGTGPEADWFEAKPVGQSVAT